MIQRTPSYKTAMNWKYIQLNRTSSADHGCLIEEHDACWKMLRAPPGPSSRGNETPISWLLYLYPLNVIWEEQLWPEIQFRCYPELPTTCFPVHRATIGFPPGGSKQLSPFGSLQFARDKAFVVKNYSTSTVHFSSSNMCKWGAEYTAFSYTAEILADGYDAKTPMSK